MSIVCPDTVSNTGLPEFSGGESISDSVSKRTAESVLSTGVTPTRDADAATAPAAAAAAACCVLWPGGMAFLFKGAETSVRPFPVMSNVLSCARLMPSVLSQDKRTV